MIAPHRKSFLEDELEKRRYQQSEVVLKNLEEQGFRIGEIHFFQGELYRLWNREGDRDRALGYYALAEEAGDFPPELYRSKGMLLLKNKHAKSAKTSLQQYLALVPDASDREMIEMYIGGLK